MESVMKIAAPEALWTAVAAATAFRLLPPSRKSQREKAVAAKENPGKSGTGSYTSFFVHVGITSRRR